VLNYIKFRFSSLHYFSGGVIIAKSLNNFNNIYLGVFNGNRTKINNENISFLKSIRGLGVISKLEYGSYLDKAYALYRYQRHYVIVKEKDINDVAYLITLNNTAKPWGIDLSFFLFSLKVHVNKVSGSLYANSTLFKF
jgi:hypothetical protein